ncbi:MAG: YlxM family DNA-binding protein [Eubacterium sp.]|jgi:predicted DNA-binding protein YlxM (UPF0122 family)
MDALNKLDNYTRESMLFDLYGGLLTDRKRAILEMHHENDMSLSEIADELNISRAAVYDSLKSAEKSLEDYESRLSLLADYMARMENTERALESLEALKKICGGDKRAQSEIDNLSGILRSMEG